MPCLEKDTKESISKIDKTSDEVSDEVSEVKKEDKEEMNLLKMVKNKQYSKVKEMSYILKNIGASYSYKSKEKYTKVMDLYHNCVNFTWRKDQKKVIKKFLKFKHKHYIIHAVFGSGKTTLLIGMLISSLLKLNFKSNDVLFISFNISIRNEIKRKLKEFGLLSKMSVRTFDSIIYEIAKIAEYPHIDLPNFDGKRRFVYEKTFDETFTFIPEYQPKVIFIDECQDLERDTLKILHKFYPNSKFIFSGDIFQSIQKEPRESVLWYFMTNDVEDTFKTYMTETPRVPPPVLESIKKALNVYYPEFRDKINSWVSGNQISNVDIKWKQLDSYNHIFQKIEKFTRKYKPEEGMILTFSSAITVRGCMGDVARIRRFMFEKGLPVNTNHKKLDSDKYFLSTANSSKGLERDYVIIFLTFPLERAFINLSDDIVVNLITVALSRAKKKVIMYVPKYEDKFSRVLNIFENCPVPRENNRINEGKTVKEFKISDYLNLEHSVTELIRMSIVKYDTRIDLKTYTKPFHFSKIFDQDINYKLLPIITDEERSFVGVMIENLITSTWTGKWPELYGKGTGIESNPMFNHVSSTVKRSFTKYNNFIKKNIFEENTQFDGIYIYSQIHIAISDKIFMSLKPELVQNLKGYWKKLKHRCHSLKPNGKTVTIQTNLQMPWITGIADAIVKKNGNKEEKEEKEQKEEIELIEIKASQDYEWKDNALLQVLIYSLMTGKTWSRLHLLNPFRNEKVSYYFNSKKVITLRNKVINDTLIFNMNSFMAKMYGLYKQKEQLDISNTLFVDIVENEKEENEEEENEEKENKIRQISVVNMVSPIKCELIYNEYTSNNIERNTKMSKTDKMRSESNKDDNTILKELGDILNSEMNKNKKRLGLVENKELGIESVFSYLEGIEDTDIEDIIKHIGYEKGDDKKYGMDILNSFHRNIFIISFLFMNRNFK